MEQDADAAATPLIACIALNGPYGAKVKRCSDVVAAFTEHYTRRGEVLKAAKGWVPEDPV